MTKLALALIPCLAAACTVKSGNNVGNVTSSNDSKYEKTLPPLPLPRGWEAREVKDCSTIKLSYASPIIETFDINPPINPPKPIPVHAFLEVNREVVNVVKVIALTRAETFEWTGRLGGFHSKSDEKYAEDLVSVVKFSIPSAKMTKEPVRCHEIVYVKFEHRKLDTFGTRKGARMF